MYSIGDKIRVTIFGQSHAEAIGTVIDGLPAGMEINMDKISRFMQRRMPGKNRYSTARKESDVPEIISGVVNGKTCGAPVCAVIKNSDTKSGDYDNLRYVPRPGHADYAAYMKYGGNNDIRGGGQFSGRMTAPLCFAGAVCMQLLEEKGISIGAHIERIHGVCDERFDAVKVSAEQLKIISGKEFPVISDEISEKMKAEIEKARMDCDSVGGIIECAVVGLEPGAGGALFSGMEGAISKAIFAIPAVKGIEFGAGFEASEMYGSENNDSFYFDGDTVKTTANNHGGILGGISSGMPVIFRAAIKPTPSIAKEQQSVDLRTKTAEMLTVKGRHDPCIVPRAVPCVEAAAAIAIINILGE
ncbi:MAG: chorismate synthase [Clostridiales bacterium]|nr:chorismate synthase [Clostridiales bacterium]